MKDSCCKYSMLNRELCLFVPQILKWLAASQALSQLLSPSSCYIIIPKPAAEKYICRDVSAICHIVNLNKVHQYFIEKRTAETRNSSLFWEERPDVVCRRQLACYWRAWRWKKTTLYHIIRFFTVLFQHFMLHVHRKHEYPFSVISLLHTLMCILNLTN